MIKNIIFDCSDTLLRFTALEELARRVGDPCRAAEIKAKIHSSRAWNLYDKGEISETGLRREILPLFSQADLPFAQWYLDKWSDCYVPIPGMLEIVKSLKEKGFRLFILSDFPPCFDAICERFSEIFLPFEGRAVSCESHSTKADLGLFIYILEKYTLTPTECLFIDDVPRLVENARSLNLTGIVFKGPEELIHDLKVLNIM